MLAQLGLHLLLSTYGVVIEDGTIGPHVKRHISLVLAAHEEYRLLAKSMRIAQFIEYIRIVIADLSDHSMSPAYFLLNILKNYARTHDLINPNNVEVEFLGHRLNYLSVNRIVRLGERHHHKQAWLLSVNSYILEGNLCVIPRE